MNNPHFWCMLAGFGAMYASWEIYSGTAFVASAFMTGASATILATGSVKI